MPRALFVYPNFPETFWGYQRALRFIGINATHPPLGLLTVAGMLPEDYEVRLIDLNVQPLDNSDLSWADIVLTGGMMIQRPSVQKIVSQCKKASVPVAIGGPDATSSSQDLPVEAHLVLGEAESPSFLKGLDELITSDERIILDLRDDSPGISEAPLPRYDILDMKNYASMALQMSRGCPFKCEFCDIPTLFGKTTRYKSIERSLEELDLLYKQNWRGSVFWVDDNFIGNKKSCKQILPPVIEWQKKHKMPFQFYTQASVNLAGDEELLELMRDAGFDSVFLGIETPIDESLKETKKLQNVKYDLLESVHKIQKAGMEVMAGFIIGFDNDPTDIDRHLIEFIQNSGVPVAMAGLLTAVPGSPLYDRLKEEGRLFETDATREGNNTFEFAFNFQTVQEPNVLVKAYKNVLREIYGKPDNYFQRIETMYENLDGKPLSNGPFTFRRFLACLRSFLMIPTSRYGWAYGKFFIRTIFRYPNRLVDAVRQGIVGLHFYELTQERLAAAEFSGFIKAAIQRVHEAYQRERQEGLAHAAHVLDEAKKRLRGLPTTIKDEMSIIYEELESTLKGLSTSSESA